MKLYFSPGACSLSPHIILHEAGLAHETEKVDLRAKTTASGKDFRTINPKGYVPALETEGGVVLTEGPAIVQYLADQAPEKDLVPPAGSIERYQVISWLNFISTEIHKNYSPLFNPAATDDVKHMAKGNLAKRYEYLDQELGQRDYVFGSAFSVADAYLFVVTNWAGMVKVDLSAYPNVQAFQERVGARPAVQKALRHEGLLT
ncbi:glutathione transferase GstA [Massilia sp. PAMC28688]|uniref:glutathione transferase GstA n=1 Tax=Massilia sp. PAMC28688 TaxID=2861283 RepID=UPI001C63286B|nr:glutathione transferase GstA [Massilia sp. PAMC28688]QYF91655.1 glutathione transferase GstA [Massilia sp. PAMC28688]